MDEPPPRTVLILAPSPGLADELSETLGRLTEWQADPRPDFGRPTATALRESTHTLLMLESGVDGGATPDLIRNLRELGDLRPVVIVTREASPRLAVDFGRCGADEYVVWRTSSPDMLGRALDGAASLADLRRNKALLAARFQLCQKMEAIGVLAGGLAHDFNNMLASIMGFAELANMKIKRGRPMGNELDFIIKGCRQMADLVQQLVRFSTRRGPQLTRVRLQEIFDDLGAVLGHSIPKSIRLVIDLSDPALTVPANPAMLQQSLMNLCLNAIDSMPDGGTLTLSAVIAPAPEALLRAHPDLAPGDYLQLSVIDTGCGIPPQNVSRIFEPFFTTKNLSATKGTGLGLTTVWQNATQHGGTVDVVSEVGKGSTFVVYLPVSADAPMSSIPRDTEPKGGRESILVVDDEILMCHVARATLESLGYRAMVAENGAEGITAISRFGEAIDCVLLDISLPDIDGREVCVRMLDLRPDLPIVFSTGHDTSAIGKQLLELGARGYLQKPFDPASMDRSIRDAIAGRPLQS